MSNLVPASQFEPLKRLVLDAVQSPLTRAQYGHALDEFFVFWSENPEVFGRNVVQRYRQHLNEHCRLSASTINQRLAAVKRLAKEARYAGLISVDQAQGVLDVEGVPKHGVKTGNWLTKDSCEDLISQPDPNTTKGIRDKALIGLLLGSGLRRSELSALDWKDIQLRDGRWAIVDLVGKHRRVRTVPIPSWVKLLLDQWRERSDDAGDGPVFVSMRKNGRIERGKRLSSQAVLRIVKEYAESLGLKLSPHDVRRTFAKLGFSGGGRLDQIQLVLGHASLKTTQDYLGLGLDLHDAACDKLGLDTSRILSKPARRPQRRHPGPSTIRGEQSGGSEA